MYISFKELKKSGNLLVGEKLLLYKINRFITGKKYAGLAGSGPLYEYVDRVKDYKISYCPGVEPVFQVHFYKNNPCIVSLYLEVLKNQQIYACFYANNLNPSLIKDFLIELCKRLGT
jgi:hypothetical protein